MSAEASENYFYDLNTLSSWNIMFIFWVCCTGLDGYYYSMNIRNTPRLNTSVHSGTHTFVFVNTEAVQRLTNRKEVLLEYFPERWKTVEAILFFREKDEKPLESIWKSLQDKNREAGKNQTLMIRWKFCNYFQPFHHIVFNLAQLCFVEILVLYSILQFEL